MKFSIQLPTDRVDPPGEFVSGEAIAAIARIAETSGFHAAYVTEHPFPTDAWLESGGHHPLDPWVALSFAAAATTRLKLQTNITVLAYRNPFLSAKAIASLDVLSGGRLIVGIGAGYLRGEFEALGADFERCNELTDEAIACIRRAWSERGITGEGSGWRAEGNTMLPTPVQVPHPPIWVGGNSRRAIHRAVDLCDGWTPFPTTGMDSGRVHTAAIETLDDLRERVAYAREYSAKVGRTRPLDICFVPFGFSMRDLREVDPVRFRAMVEGLAGLGVTWLTLALPGRSRPEYCARLKRFGDEVLGKL